MSAVFESLRKLEQKDKAKKLTVARPLPEIEPETNPGDAKHWFLPWLLVLTVVFIGFALFAHLKYRGLGEVVSSRQKAFDIQFNRLSKRIDEIDQKIKSVDKNTQMIKAQQDHFSKEMEKERDAQSKITGQQTKLIEDRFNQLSKRVKSLEEQERQNTPPQETQVR